MRDSSSPAATRARDPAMKYRGAEDPSCPDDAGARDASIAGGRDLEGDVGSLSSFVRCCLAPRFNARSVSLKLNISGSRSPERSVRRSPTLGRYKPWASSSCALPDAWLPRSGAGRNGDSPRPPVKRMFCGLVTRSPNWVTPPAVVVSNEPGMQPVFSSRSTGPASPRWRGARLGSVGSRQGTMPLQSPPNAGTEIAGAVDTRREKSPAPASGVGGS